MKFKVIAARRNFLTSVLKASGVAAVFGLKTDLMAAGPRTQVNQGRDGSVAPPRLYETSTRATTMLEEAADRLALRKLVDAWAHCADRRLAKEQSELFVPDGSVVAYDGDPATRRPIGSLKGRAEILKALAVLNTFTATTHFNGQSDVVLDGIHAFGETYCLAHQISEEKGQRKLQILSIRYQDRFIRERDRWYFVERRLITDWTDTRLSSST